MRSRLKIGIVDLVGLPYDGSSLQKKGIGGSESAVISMSRELVKLGFEVVVLNDCLRDNSQPGNYDGVIYCPIQKLAQQDFGFDIVISVRSVTPFAPRQYWAQTQRPSPWNYDQTIYSQLQKSSQLKIVWLQDTFCWGDELLELLTVNGYIDQIFTLSDWHTSYITHCTHGPRRMFEVLKPRIFQTRNAVNNYINAVDINKKDPFHYVYNASVNKGMVPLLEKIWPRVHAAIPQSHLTVIGGYYQFPDTEPDASVQQVQQLQRKYQNDPSVKFTGIITQPQIAGILANASYTIYPAVFPETSGISTLESIYYNTPVLGCRFGAMAESGTELAGYYIDYPIEPNILFPDINSERQLDRFVDMVVRASQDRYLHQQKQYACNRIREIATWDTVALQWKQHFYQHFDLTLSSAQQQQVQWINHRVHQVFGRQFINPVESTKHRSEFYQYSLPNPTLEVAIVDIPGMSYTGDTLEQQGLGGSESAVILVSRELAKLGINVTVFNGCNEDGRRPGLYDGVRYLPLAFIPFVDKKFDVVISSRTAQPFADEKYQNHNFRSVRSLPKNTFDRLRSAAIKIVWMHDTFSWGDEVIENMIQDQLIDQVWCLSDFHLHYFMNCEHGPKRNYEVLKSHMWITRNGIQKYQVNVERDSNLFLFNANHSKGLSPLLKEVWPRVLNKIPQARLVVVGGFYNLGSAFNDINRENNEFEKIIAPYKNLPSITFTGIITQKQVAEWAAKSSYFIYPASLPETFGISAWESLCQGTPLITTRFGALEETATKFSTMIDYPVEPNVLYPNIDSLQQIEKFVDLVVDTYLNKNSKVDVSEICDIAGWDTVALQWKQQLYQLTDRYISPNETRAINYSLSKYHEITGRRYTNLTNHISPKHNVEQRIAVITPFRNAAKYIEKCIMSVAAQNYSNYHHYLINDASDDSSSEIIERLVEGLPNELNDHFTLIENERSLGAVCNQISMIRELTDDTIIMLLDGDDWLANRSDIFDYYNNLYHQGTEFSYGSCWSVTDNIPLIAQPYPEEVRRTRTYRNHRFNWGLPYTHLRTFRKRLINYINDTAFKDHTGQWYTAGGDGAVFYAVLEQATWNRITVVSDIMYHYNDANPQNDYKVNGLLQNQNAAEIAQRLPQTTQLTKRILIAIPTAKYIEPQTFKSIYDLNIPLGYHADFQYFYGYRIDQIRNLIAHWAVSGYDYLFAVDSDISFPPDTLEKLLSHDVDIVSGVYRQRLPEQKLELYQRNNIGGVSNIVWENIRDQGLVEIAGCGFGCVLVKAQVLRDIGAPQFEYHVALDHNQTVSEDVDFCRKATDRGFRIWADTDVICDHHGSTVYQIQ